MKKQGRLVSAHPRVVSLPTGNRVVVLMRSIKAELEKDRQVTYEMLGHYTNQSASAALEKFHRSHQPQVEGLISLLERVPPQVRHQLIDSACRVFPSLDHWRLAHDPVQVSRLKTILTQRSGVTFIQGPNAGACTFLVTALGHQIQTIESGECSVSGIDVHRPNWFVPVDRVLYLNNVLAPQALKEAGLEAWRRLELQRPSRLVIFNGIWLIKGLRERVAEVAESSHVVLAGDLKFELPQLSAQFPGQIHLVSVSADHQDRIRTVIESP